MNRVIILLAAAFALGGCTKVDINTRAPEDKVAVTFAETGIYDAAPVSRATSSKLAEGTTVRVLAYERKGVDADLSVDPYMGENTYVARADGSLEACVVDANGQKIAGVATALYLVEGTYDFYAITPALAVNQATAKAKVKHHHDYATSFTGAQNVQKGTGSATQTVILTTLARKSSKVEFVLERLGNNYNEVVVQEVTLKNMTNEGTGGIDAVLAEDIDLTSVTRDQTVTLGQSYFTQDAVNKWKATGSAIILPKTAGDMEIGMKVQYDGGSVLTLSSPAIENFTFKPGYRYIFTVKLLGSGIGIELEVEPWETEDWTTDIGESELQEEDGKTWEMEVETGWVDDSNNPS